jgi:hypothetical protein
MLPGIPLLAPRRTVDIQVRKLSSGLGDLAMCPGDFFAVCGVVAQGAVQDADEAVAGLRQIQKLLSR